MERPADRDFSADAISGRLGRDSRGCKCTSLDDSSVFVVMWSLVCAGSRRGREEESWREHWGRCPPPPPRQIPPDPLQELPLSPALEEKGAWRLWSGGEGNLLLVGVPCGLACRPAGAVPRDVLSWLRWLNE